MTANDPVFSVLVTYFWTFCLQQFHVAAAFGLFFPVSQVDPNTLGCCMAHSALLSFQAILLPRPAVSVTPNFDNTPHGMADGQTSLTQPNSWGGARESFRILVRQAPNKVTWEICLASLNTDVRMQTKNFLASSYVLYVASQSQQQIGFEKCISFLCHSLTYPRCSNLNSSDQPERKKLAESNIHHEAEMPINHFYSGPVFAFPQCISSVERSA